MKNDNWVIYFIIIGTIIAVLFLVAGIFVGIHNRSEAKITCDEHNETIYKFDNGVLLCYDNDGIIHVREGNKNESTR